MSLFTLQTNDQEQYGPVELETLRIWAREGRIERNNVIYDHTRLKWIEASRLPQIMDYFPPIGATLSTPPVIHQNFLSKNVTGNSLTQAQKEFVAHPKATAENIKESMDSVRPPSIIARISQIFLTPFTRKKGGARKKSK